jgi:hypothetical protein
MDRRRGKKRIEERRGGVFGEEEEKKKGTLLLRCSILTVAPTSTSCRPSKKCLSFFFYCVM